TSHSSRKYHPLPTIPCSDGITPVMYVAWAEHVTAGSTPPTGVVFPCPAHFVRNGVCAPNNPGVNPTTFNTTVFFIPDYLQSKCTTYLIGDGETGMFHCPSLPSRIRLSNCSNTHSYSLLIDSVMSTFNSGGNTSHV